MNSPANRILFIALSFATSLLCVAQNNRGQQQLPDSVDLLADLPYAGTDNPRQMLDLILPKERAANPLPVVVFIHGGGWRNGQKNGGRRRVAPFVETGEFAGATVGYRLSSEAKWPTQIHDCKAAIRWIRANAKKYNLDPERIGVWGTSAGGHLVSMLGTSGDVASMDGELGPHTDVSSRITCVADFFGPTNFLTMDATDIPSGRIDHDSADSPESLLIGGPIQEHPEKVATANPITYVSADDSPFLIVHGTMDPLVSFNQSELLHTALQKSKVETTLITIEGGGHGQGFGSKATELVKRFFDHHLRNVTSSWQDETLQAVSRQRR